MLALKLLKKLALFFYIADGTKKISEFNRVKLIL